MIFEKYNTGTHDVERDTIVGTTVIMERVDGGNVWKHEEHDIIKYFGHKTVKDFIKHLKNLDYKQADKEAQNHGR